MKKNKKENTNVLTDASSVGLVQKTGIPKTILGMLCRFAVAYIGVCGVCMMLDDAFMFFNGKSDPLRVCLISFICCAAFYLVFTAAHTNVVFFSLSLAALLVAVAVIDLQNGIKQSVIFIPVSAWNHILMRLDALGYSALSGLVSKYPETNPVSSTGLVYVMKAFNSFAALVSFIFVASTYKRVRIVPVIVISGMVMTVTFTYNILTNNVGFVMMIASGFGIMVMKYSDSFSKAERETEKKEKLKFFEKRRLQVKNASTRGFAALLATAVVLGVAAYPAARINRPAPELSVFNDFMDGARAAVSELLTGRGAGAIGDDPYAQHKTVTPSPRSFSSRRMFTVSATSYVPLYLRTWVGEEYRNNQWIAANGSGNVLPEEVTELFYTIVDVDGNVFVPAETNDTDSFRRGYVKEFVSVKAPERRSSAYLASRFSTLYGITDPYDMNAKYAGGYKIKPGVGTCELNDMGRAYGFVSYAQNYKGVSLSKLNNDMIIYDIVYPLITGYINARLQNAGADTETLTDALKLEAKRQAAARGIEIPAGCIVNRIGDMSDAELTSLAKKMADVSGYESGVYDRYLSVPWSETEALREITKNALGVTKYVYNANEAEYYGLTQSYPSSSLFISPRTDYIIDSPATRMSDIYTLADKTARYLSTQCEYTLEPHGYSSNGSYTVQFLTEAKNGYCVQFATAGALLLRSIGIPTRYVDGYLAPEMRYSGGMYTCTVLDNNAHAWIEVYIKGYGWMTFEMTSPMISGMYRSSTPAVTPETDIPPVVTETTEPPDSDTGNTQNTTPHGPVTDPVTMDVITTEPGGRGVVTGIVRKVILITVISLFVILLISTLIYLYLKKTTLRHKKFMRMLKRAADGGSADPGGDINKIAEYIKLLLSKIGLVRAENEMMTDFAARVDLEVEKRSFGPASEALQKNTFGHCADGEDAKTAAVYALYLRKKVLARMSRFDKFRYVTLRKLI